MLFCYLDESGNTGSRLDDSQQPFHYLAAVIVREDHVARMTELLDEIAQNAPTSTGLAEFHAQQLFAGSGPWADVPPSVRIAQYSKALSVLGEIDASIIYSSIDKPALAEWGPSTSPHLYALQFLTEKLEDWMKSNHDPLSQMALLVADQNHQEEEYAFDLVRRMHRSGGPVGEGTGLAKATKHIVDTVYFAPSERSRGIQLADLVAFVLIRRDRDALKPNATPSSRAIERLFMDHIATRRVRWRQRWPS